MHGFGKNIDRREYKFKGEKDTTIASELAGLAPSLDSFLDSFRHLLRAGNHCLYPKASQYFRGLFQAEKSNVEQMCEAVPDSEYQSLHHFISASPWSDQLLRGEIARRANRLIGGTGMSGLLFDESPSTKKGRDSVGVARQWSGQLGKVDNCQVAVYACLTRGSQACLLDAKLYLPEIWTNDPPRCHRAGIPQADQVFKPKTQLALEMVEDVDRHQIGYAWIGADAGYGKEPAFLRALDQLNKVFVVDVPQTQRVYLQHPKLSTSPLSHASGGTGRLRFTRKPVSLGSWVPYLPQKYWKKISIRESSRGLLAPEFFHTQVWVFDKKYDQQPHRWHLLVRRDLGEDGFEYKYSLSNAPLTTTLSVLAWRQSQRYRIEQAFQEAKQELGMDDYQVRTWRAWHHHTTMTLLANLFLLEMKRLHQKALPQLSFRDLRKLLIRLLPQPPFIDCVHQMIQRHQQRDHQIRRRVVRARGPTVS